MISAVHLWSPSRTPFKKAGPLDEAVGASAGKHLDWAEWADWPEGDLGALRGSWEVGGIRGDPRDGDRWLVSGKP